ncbi:MAG: diaminopimelate decarboxylase [Tissierellia bacterium]|nr:diaminopimelate decarboxylase [Tissierellia bacterium]MDD3226332.1 diaminopimelate decarboxylase [Tissierellia bacterium]MDD3750562.1 diaminopimelate decarboxylase [Tissierellia bacterium]MDD4045681.1 diaminopimelate decarboxylase [Tissierellia bacterium]MDD4677722.1 diaminopimelate decarboxylase [Tissierellia bacterium]
MVREIKDNILYFDGCNTVELAKKYGTPLFVMSETAIVDKCKEIRDTFINKYERTRAAYASKAFLTLSMCKIIEREGLCLDVVSGGELYTAIKADFPAEKIEFNGNNKSVEELEIAIDYNIGRIIVDGFDELGIIEDICKKKGKKSNILYRITPGVKSDSHDYIVTGKKDSKFGFPLDDDVIFPAIEKAISSPHINFLGFHFHVGSQLHNNESHLKALKIALKLIKDTIDKYNYITQELNIGGGFGIKYTDADDKKPYAYFLDPMMEEIEEFSKRMSIKRPEIVIEPGRSIVGEAGLTLYTIGTIKDIKGIRKYVSVDGGMTDNIRPALYQAKYESVIANKAAQPSNDLVTISGKCCESGDILIRDAYIPLAERGDILAIFSTGAYGYAMASNYNKNPMPAIVLVKEGKAEVIVKRQTYEHMIENEVIPKSLM